MSNEQLDDVLIPEHHKNAAIKWRIDFLNRIKFFLLAVVAIALLFKLQHWQFGSELFILGCCSLTITYFIQPFLMPKNNWGEMIKYFGFAFLWIAVLFRMQHWQYAQQIIITSVATVALGYLLSLLKIRSNN